MIRPIAFVALLSAVSVTVAAQAPAADPIAEIRAAQRQLDHEYARALMSPFAAVAVVYVAPGQSARLGVDATRAVFDPGAPMADTLDITLLDGAFHVTPVSGSQPVMLRKSDTGDVDVASGTPMTGRTRLSDRDVIGLGRYFVESFPGPDSGNVRVFDPEAAAKKAYDGRKWFAPDPAWQVSATFVPFATPEKVVIATSRGLQKDYYRIGRLSFTALGQKLALTVLSPSPSPKDGEGLFVPFRDATTGKESYQVGRYLFPKYLGANATYRLDFNLATNPLCNYSPHYNCPIPPRENVLAVAMRAGEMTYPIH